MCLLVYRHNRAIDYNSQMNVSPNALPSIQCLWVGERLNRLARLSLASFIAHGHSVHLYTYAPVKNLPTGVTVMDANAILPYNKQITITEGFGQGSIAPFSDWFRFKLLHDRGGIWADTDVVCLTPWANLPEYVIASERVPPDALSLPHSQATSCVLRFPLGDPFMAYCLQQVEHRLAQGELTWGVIGPHLIETALAEFPDYHDRVLAPEVMCSLNTWEVSQLIKPNTHWKPSPHALGVHCWQELWRYSMSTLKARPLWEQSYYWLHPTRTLNVHRRYPRTTPLGHWQAQYGT